MLWCYLSYGDGSMGLLFNVTGDFLKNKNELILNLHIVWGDIYALPFERGVFKFVYSLGVLQHKPDVNKAFSALPLMVRGGGQLCVDYYWKRIRTILHIKYLLRPYTKRIAHNKLFSLLQKSVPSLLAVSQTLGRVPVLGQVLKRLVPVAD